MRSFFLHNLWKWSAGIPEVDSPTHHFSLREAQMNWSEHFVALMRNRMLVGIYRYGSFRDPGQEKYDRCGSAIRRIQSYISTGNQEHLVDAANLLMIEFERGDHPTAHFAASDDGEHTPVKG